MLGSKTVIFRLVCEKCKYLRVPASPRKSSRQLISSHLLSLPWYSYEYNDKSLHFTSHQSSPYTYTNTPPPLFPKPCSCPQTYQPGPNTLPPTIHIHIPYQPYPTLPSPHQSHVLSDYPISCTLIPHPTHLLSSPTYLPPNPTLEEITTQIQPQAQPQQPSPYPYPYPLMREKG